MNITNEETFPFRCSNPEDIWQTINEPWCEQAQTNSQSIPNGSAILINEHDPTAFLKQLWTGLLANAAIILANPSWQQQEWQQVANQISPDIVLGQSPPVLFSTSNHRLPPGTILIATGGTSGQIKFVIHTWATLTTAAKGFLDHFDQRPVNSYCVLPLHHVSGLMQAVRVWLSGGHLVVQPFKQLKNGHRLITPDSDWFISLVPTQLQKLIQNDSTMAWLTQFRAILLGGAPAWPELLNQTAHLPIALTYGMSETAAQVATLLPEEFHRGIRSNGAPLPHVKLAIHQPASSQSQPADTIGRVAIQTDSLGLGYWPDTRFISPWFYPDDLGYLDKRGHLHIVGRNSQKIVTGGENVFPAEVEAALLETGLVKDVCVVGLPDRVWGQAVAALYVSSAPSNPIIPRQLKQSLESRLSAYKHPKHWHGINQIPRNAQGKVNRSQVVACLTAAIASAQDSRGDAGD